MRTLLSTTLFTVLVIALACTQPPTGADAHSSAAFGADTSPAPVEPSETPEAAEFTSAAALEHSELAWRLQLPEMIETVMPSVVGIATERTLRQTRSSPSPFDDPFFRQLNPFGFGPPQHRQAPPRERVQQGIGSGVIVDPAGVILTNNHVIDGADRILIHLSDGRELQAEVKGTDPSSDIAVLQILEAPDDLKAIRFGDSDALRLGESVVAIGNPFGLSGTVTLGIISAKGRANVGILDYEDFIQTDAAINPGNSGGALINLRGELIGINTAIMTRSGGYQGVGFAIPSNMVKMVMESLVETGEVLRGWLGVHIQQLTPELAGALGVDKNLRGVVVSDVQAGSPAELAGLQRGDLITTIDSRAVPTPAALRNTIGLRAPGTPVEITFLRGPERKQLQLSLGSLNQHLRGQEELHSHQDSAGDNPVDGLELQALTRELRRQFNLPDSLRQGLVITNIRPESDAARLQLRRGDVLLELNRRPLSSPADFAAAYDPNRPQNLFLLYRDGATVFMTR